MYIRISEEEKNNQQDVYYSCVDIAYDKGLPVLDGMWLRDESFAIYRIFRIVSILKTLFRPNNSSRSNIVILFCYRKSRDKKHVFNIPCM